MAYILEVCDDGFKIVRRLANPEHMKIIQDRYNSNERVKFDEYGIHFYDMTFYQSQQVNPKEFLFFSCDDREVYKLEIDLDYSLFLVYSIPFKELVENQMLHTSTGWHANVMLHFKLDKPSGTLRSLIHSVN